jgi:rhodanese-related sulfurtransferase
MPVRSVFDMVDEAKAALDNLSCSEAQRRVDVEGALIVDIRDIRELQRDGCIPGAHHTPRGMLEFWVSPDSPHTKDIFQHSRELIICCAGGMRSALAAKALQDMGVDKVSHLESGFEGWRDTMPTQTHDEWKAARSA